MREIKFRAWTGSKIVSLDGVCSKGGFVDVQPFDIYGRVEREMYSNVIQYTGLKDKNGVEIYEGDICKVVGSGNLQAIIDPLHGLCFGDYTVTYHDCMMENDEIEVIGNIYENPELLGE